MLANPSKFALRADAGLSSWSLGRTSLDTTVTPALVLPLSVLVLRLGYDSGVLTPATGRLESSFLNSFRGPSAFPLGICPSNYSVDSALSRLRARKQQEPLVVDRNCNCLK